MRYVAKIKVAGKTLHLGYFSRKSEADIVFKAAAKVRAQLDQYFVQETKRIREHQDRVIAERLNGAK